MQAWEGEVTAIRQGLIRAGDTAVARMDSQVRGRASGSDTHLAITNVNVIERGKIVLRRHCLDHEEALKAVGLEE